MQRLALVGRPVIRSLSRSPRSCIPSPSPPVPIASLSGESESPVGVKTVGAPLSLVTGSGRSLADDTRQTSGSPRRGSGTRWKSPVVPFRSSLSTPRSLGLPNFRRLGLVKKGSRTSNSVRSPSRGSPVGNGYLRKSSPRLSSHQVRPDPNVVRRLRFLKGKDGLM